MDSDIDKNRNTISTNYAFVLNTLYSQDAGKQIKANFPQIKNTLFVHEIKPGRRASSRIQKSTPKKFGHSRLSQGNNTSPFNSSMYLTSGTSSSVFVSIKENKQKIMRNLKENS
uniref:Uncharacterized protein n=1 Tax=Euplotes harpa TaxID=151035 RepID=A0A7S3JG12_9SPIT|mmetsp:Transcript_38856/g.44446  ORF Transcript_38856/g.44446 Transcript_38856/m.44446 type:complete len:114 (+) Transcript_38856:97-438(+)